MYYISESRSHAGLDYILSTEEHKFVYTNHRLVVERWSH
jgi:hypothetical protein